MKNIVLFIVLMIISHLSNAQEDTFTEINQRGYLFLSSHNYQYDHQYEEIRSLGFHDFFFPIEKFDIKTFQDSNKRIELKNGLRIDFIKDRGVLKKQALRFDGKDTSLCYRFDEFYIVPVSIKYKRIKEYEPYVCHRNYFDIQIKDGSALHFEYLHQAIKPVAIVPLKSSSRIKKRKR